MSLHIPRQRLYECSALLRDSLEANNVTLLDNPQAVVAIGRHVIGRVIPEFHRMLSTDITVNADSVVQTHDGFRRPIMSAEFTGNLSTFKISELEMTEYIEGIGEVPITRTDIMLIFKQRISNPDPVDLGYSEEILVPMSEVDSLVFEG